MPYEGLAEGTLERSGEVGAAINVREIFVVDGFEEITSIGIVCSKLIPQGEVPPSTLIVSNITVSAHHPPTRRC